MSDNKVNNEEYSFPNKEDKEKYSMSPIGGTESVLSLLKNKKLMKSLGMVLLFYFVLQGVTYFFANKNVADTEIESDVAAIKVEPIKVEAESFKPVEEAEKPVVKDSLIAGNHKQLERLSAEILSQDLSIDRFKSRLRDIEKSQQELSYKVNNFVKNYKESMVYLMAYVKKQKQLESDKLKAAMLKAKAVKAKPKKLDVYYIRATINGRAWLVKKDTEQNITIKIGDKLPTYGSIINIDQDAGKIETTSGRLIHLSPEDS